jgi:hypothetical protein
MPERLYADIRKWSSRIDWALLAFLLLVLDVKLVVKLAALVLVYVYRFNHQFGLRLRNARLPLFYPLIIVTGLLSSAPTLFSGEPHYWLVLLLGIAFWAASFLIIHQLKLFVERTSAARLHATIQLFFVLNILASTFNLLAIFREIGLVNPYRYQGQYQKYFIGTGDFIRGITFDTSTTNAMICAAGVIYAICRRQLALALGCMIVLLLTGSNFTNLALIACLVWLFVFRSDRYQKTISVLFPALLVVFLTNISPQNNKYSFNILSKVWTGKNDAPLKPAVLLPIEQRPDSLLSPEEKKYKLAKQYLDSAGKALREKETGIQVAQLHAERPTIPQPNIHAPEFQHRQDTNATRLQVIQLSHQLQIDTLKTVQQLDVKKANGKVESLRYAIAYFRRHPQKIILGDGIGNFSSKLAFRATGLGIAGGYPAKYVYINKDFEANQLAVYLDFFSRDSGLHSVVNTPNSVYLQLFTEYGIVGVALFLLAYVGFFIRHARGMSYGFGLLLLLMLACFVDYWFEQLSAFILIEFLIFLNRKDHVGAR